MKNIVENSEFKAILHSKRANIYYLEKCRVMQKDGRVLYLTENREENNYWNIPLANTTVILLGTGTSITQAAVRMLAAAGVVVGFAGAGGTPLIAGMEVQWLTPANEYRPTEYVQKWCQRWFDEEKRLKAGKLFQRKRCEYLQRVWEKDDRLQEYGFFADEYDIVTAISVFKNKIAEAHDTVFLLTAEAAFTKALYKFAAANTNVEGFVREQRGNDLANRFLDHGNYLAYGTAATALWVLGIPHGFPVLHGKTRRGALVFDVADLIKDAVVLPFSFIAANELMKEQEFRQLILQKFIDHEVMDYMIDTIKGICNSD